MPNKKRTDAQLKKDPELQKNIFDVIPARHRGAIKKPSLKKITFYDYNLLGRALLKLHEGNVKKFKALIPSPPDPKGCGACGPWN
jgi:hypothetical protein